MFDHLLFFMEYVMLHTQCDMNHVLRDNWSLKVGNTIRRPSICMQDEHSFDLMTFSDHFSCVHAATMFLGLAQQNQIRKTIFSTQPQWIAMNSKLRNFVYTLKDEYMYVCPFTWWQQNTLIVNRNLSLLQSDTPLKFKAFKSIIIGHID